VIYKAIARTCYIFVKNMSRNVIVKDSATSGKGVFSERNFEQGDFVLAIDDSKIVTDNSKLTEQQHEFDLDYVDGKTILMQEPEKYINHSCDPNVYVKTTNYIRNIYAMKPIKQGDEITYDYSINGDNEGTFICHCHSKNCRKLYLGDFFKLPIDVRLRYLPFLDDWFVHKHKSEIEKIKNMKNYKVILLTGPGGSGKTTIAELLRDKYGYSLVDGDQLDTEFFPNGGQWYPQNKSKLANAHSKILATTKKEYDLGKNVVVDYIIFGDYLNFFAKFKKEFGKNLDIKVLFPSEEETISRDKNRQNWTTGAERIKTVREEFTSIRNIIGKENFIDTSGQTPEKTLGKILINNEQPHKNILVTGISGTGKSALSEELQKMGYQAYDLEMIKGLFDMFEKSTGKRVTYHFDSNKLEEMEKYNWLCDIPKLKELIKNNKDKTVFYCGTGTNINDLVPLFDKTILLNASEDVIRHRLSTRTSNDYGKSTEIQDWTFSWKDWWEDNMRELGAIEVDANGPLDVVARDIINHVMKKIYAVYCIVKLTKHPSWLDDFRKKYDEAYDFHITLKQSAFIEENQLDEIKKILDRILNDFAKNKSKIRLTFDKLLLDEGEDTEKSGYIYLFSKNNDLIDDLQIKIRADLKDYSNYLNPKSIDYEYDFKPHITIARGLVGNRFKKAVADLKNDYTCEGEITEVVLSCVKEISVAEAHNPENLTVYKL